MFAWKRAKGDVKVSDTTGNVKVTGKGGEIEVINATGSFTLDGDFYGPVRADKIAKGIRLITVKTDLTLSSLAGIWKQALEIWTSSMRREI